MSSSDTIAELRAELDTQEGAARLANLVRLGQELGQRYWEIGPGSPAALSELNGAVAALTEAHGYMAADDGLRGQVAALLGLQLATRHTAHTMDEGDREAGIRILGEALTFTNLPPILWTMDQIALGQLYLGKVTAVLQPGTVMTAMTAGVPRAALSDADRAARCFREVLAGELRSDEIISTAESLLALTQALRDILGGLGGGPAGFDIDRLMGAMRTVQAMQRNVRQPGGGLRVPAATFAPFDADKLAALDPIDRPVTVVRKARPAAGPVPPRAPAVAPAPADRVHLRRSLHDKLGEAGVTADTLWSAGEALLGPAAMTAPVDVVDDLVALASLLVEAPDPDEGTRAVDSFVLAASLRLRDRLDAGGDNADRLAGARSLLAAARTVPLDHPGAITMLRALGAFLERDQPLGRVLDSVAKEFGDRLETALASGVVQDPADLATLHALRCVCDAALAAARLRRATAQLRQAETELHRAAGTVPVDYPWLPTLRAAVQPAG